MITNLKVIRELRFDQRAILLAAACYKEWHSDVDFITDLDDYHLNGVVISFPQAFGMAKVIVYKGKPAWFVRIAVGDLVTLLALLPYLPMICFCRRNDGRVRAYTFERLMRLAVKLKKKGLKWAEEHQAFHHEAFATN